MNNAKKFRKVLPNIVGKISYNKDVLNVVQPTGMQHEHSAGSTPKVVLLSLAGNFFLRALHKRKEALKGMV